MENIIIIEICDFVIILSAHTASTTVTIHIRILYGSISLFEWASTCFPSNDTQKAD